jgi:guanine deaminase
MPGRNAKDTEYLKMAIELARQGISGNHGGPFGAIVVRDDAIIGRGFNQVTSSNDPTAHAEIVAIRDACRNINSFHLEKCTLYSTCEPCPMCLGAVYWASIERIVFSLSRTDARIAGFNDELIYNEIGLPYNLRKIKTSRVYLSESLEIFTQWAGNPDKIEY